MSQKVTAIIDPKTNEVSYEVEGIQGTSCKDITEAIIQSNQQLDGQHTHEYEVPDVLPDYINDMSGE
jgi:hypothetical protein